MTYSTSYQPFDRRDFIQWIQTTLGEVQYQEFLEIQYTFQKLITQAVAAGHATRIDDGIEWNTIEIMQEYLDHQWPKELLSAKIYWAKTKQEWINDQYWEKIKQDQSNNQ